jgi:cytochrome c553
MAARELPAFNQRRATLASALAGVDVGGGRRGIPQRSARTGSAATRMRLRRETILAAIGLMLASTAAAGGPTGGEQARRETNEVLRLVANPARGADIFAYCSACHDSTANGLPEGWVPHIRGQNAKYLAKQLVDYQRNRRWDARMQPMAQGHGLRGAQDIADVVGFLAAQSPDWKIEGKGTPADKGDKQFYESQCGGCHGTSGEGNGLRYVPRLAGQDFAYLLRQMHDVVDGRRPGMRSAHYAALENLDVVQLVALSRFLSHLGASEGSGQIDVPTGDAPSCLADQSASPEDH